MLFNPAVTIISPYIGGTVDGATEGSIFFAGPAGVLAQDNANLFFDDTNNRLGVGTNAPATRLHLSLADAATNSVVTLATYDHITSGTAADGFGSAALWTLEDAGGTLRSAARQQVFWSTAAAGTRKASLLWSVFDTAEREGMQLLADGAQARVGFGISPQFRFQISGAPVGGAFFAVLPTSFASGDIAYYAQIPAVTGNISAMLLRGTATQTVSAFFQNLDTSSSASVMFEMNVGGASAGDPYLLFTVSGVTNWSFGIDNDDSDTLKIGPVSTPSTGGAAMFAMTTEGLLTEKSRDAQTAGITTTHTLLHRTTGTPADGYGSRILCQLDANGNSERNAAAITWEWATAADASRKARGKLFADDFNGSRECIRWEADGTNPMVGFLGGGAVVKQTSGANLTNNVTSGGTTDQIDDWTNLTVYATDAAAIRNAVFQLARKVSQLNTGLRNFSLFT